MFVCICICKHTIAIVQINQSCHHILQTQNKEQWRKEAGHPFVLMLLSEGKTVASQVLQEVSAEGRNQDVLVQVIILSGYIGKQTLAYKSI